MYEFHLTIVMIRIRDKVRVIYPLRRLDRGYDVSGNKARVASFTAKANERARNANLARKGN